MADAAAAIENQRKLDAFLVDNAEIQPTVAMLHRVFFESAARDT